MCVDYFILYLYDRKYKLYILRECTGSVYIPINLFPMYMHCATLHYLDIYLYIYIHTITHGSYSRCQVSIVVYGISFWAWCCHLEFNVECCTGMCVCVCVDKSLQDFIWCESNHNWLTVLDWHIFAGCCWPNSLKGVSIYKNKKIINTFRFFFYKCGDHVGLKNIYILIIFNRSIIRTETL